SPIVSKVGAPSGPRTGRGRSSAGEGGSVIGSDSSSAPCRPPFPFVQGYEVLGEVDALGPGVTGLAKPVLGGDRGARPIPPSAHGGFPQPPQHVADDVPFAVRLARDPDDAPMRAQLRAQLVLAVLRNAGEELRPTREQGLV